MVSPRTNSTFRPNASHDFACGVLANRSKYSFDPKLTRVLLAFSFFCVAESIHLSPCWKNVFPPTNRPCSCNRRACATGPAGAAEYVAVTPDEAVTVEERLNVIALRPPAGDWGGRMAS